MPTRRMIDPAIWQSETIAALTIRQRLLFVGLFSNADDQGRLRGNPALIRSLVFPYDDIPLSEIELDLAAIQAIGSIIIYEADGKCIIQVTGWWEYQTPQWAYPSKYPAPTDWEDRLRYRQNNAVHLQNWPSAKTTPSEPLPKAPDEPRPNINEELPNDLGKALPNDLGKALGGSIEIVVGIDTITPNGVGAEAPPAKPKKSQLEVTGPKKQLMGVFQAKSNLIMPHKESEQRYWWSEIGEILQIAGGDVETGIKLVNAAIDHMRQQKLTIKGPGSITGTCRALAAGQDIGQNGNCGHISPQVDLSEAQLKRLRELQQERDNAKQRTDTS